MRALQAAARAGRLARTEERRQPVRGERDALDAVKRGHHAVDDGKAPSGEHRRVQPASLDEGHRLDSARHRSAALDDPHRIAGRHVLGLLERGAAPRAGGEPMLGGEVERPAAGAVFAGGRVAARGDEADTGYSQNVKIWL